MILTFLATDEVRSYDFEHRGISFTLVDTPGFDDSRGIEREVVQRILGWLENLTGQKTMLNGLLYFHRIIDPKLTGTARANMRLFTALCGKDNMKNVVLATTFWDKIEISKGEWREMQLRDKPDFWKPMLEKGSQTARLKNDRTQNLEILVEIAEKDQQFYSQTQKEILSGTAAAQTTAACQANIDLSAFQREYEDKLKDQMSRLKDEQRKKSEEQEEATKRVTNEIQRDRNSALAWQRSEQQKILRENLERQKEEERRRGEDDKQLNRLREQVAQQKRLEEQERIKLRQWKEHICRQSSTKRYPCDWCGQRLDKVGDGTWCYREFQSPLLFFNQQLFQTRMALLTKKVLTYPDCCFCDNDIFFSCQSCGAHCRDSDHPLSIMPVEQTTARKIFH